MILNFLWLINGGYYMFIECKLRESVVIIILFWGREEYLWILLNNLYLVLYC